MSEQLKEVWSFKITPETLKQIQQVDKEYRKKKAIEWGEEACTYTTSSDNEFRISAARESELAPFYDPKSKDFSLTKQGEIFTQNPAIHDYMCRKFGLKTAMYYGN